MIDTIVHLIYSEINTLKPNLLCSNGIKIVKILADSSISQKARNLTDMTPYLDNAQPISLDDLETYFDAILLGPLFSNLITNLSKFLEDIDFSLAVISPVMICKSVMFGITTGNKQLLSRLIDTINVRKDTESKIGLRFLRFAEGAIAFLRNQPNNQDLINNVISDLFSSIHDGKLDDELLYILAASKNKNLLRIELDSSLGELLLEYIETKIREKLVDILLSRNALIQDTEFVNLTLVRILLDSKPRNAHLQWLPKYDEDDFQHLEIIFEKASSQLLQIAPFFLRSLPVVNILEDDIDLMLSYWSGAALILLESTVMMKIKQLDESIYDNLIKEKASFYKRVKKLEQLASPGVSGVLTDKFYQIRNKVVHGEAGLTMFDLEEIVGFVSRFMTKIL